MIISSKIENIGISLDSAGNINKPKSKKVSRNKYE